MAKSVLILDAYKPFLADIKARVRSAQYLALKAVNHGLIGLYWDIGQMIAARQTALGWGKSVVEQLAADLRAEFPGIGGFSASNLWRMKAFFETYGDHEKLAPLVREIGWSHNQLIKRSLTSPDFGTAIHPKAQRAQIYSFTSIAAATDSASRACTLRSYILLAKLRGRANFPALVALMR